MKTILRTVLLAAAATLLAGCATTDGMASRQAVQPDGQARYITDVEYMSRVERRALSRGVEVHWVQPPTRLVAASDP
ncbi:hypothetical protein WCE41_02410 [Luteimonas sp. MJ246]|uniref:hypothetical protein n=1 Tax=Luteimonas sp. MJ174 TaxID=3129237 RepID=UPI0031BB814A